MRGGEPGAPAELTGRLSPARSSCDKSTPPAAANALPELLLLLLLLLLLRDEAPADLSGVRSSGDSGAPAATSARWRDDNSTPSSSSSSTAGAAAGDAGDDSADLWPLPGRNARCRKPLKPPLGPPALLLLAP